MDISRTTRKKYDELIALLERIQRPDHEGDADLQSFQQRYEALDTDERQGLFEELLPLFEVSRSDVAAAIQSLGKPDEITDPVRWSSLVSDLRRKLVSPRMRAFRRFLGISGGLKFLLDFRADVVKVQRRTARSIEPLDEEIAHLFNTWFHEGFLFLDEITLDSSYRVMSFLAQHDMVHPMTSIEQMAHRLGEDRRCFALYHRAMPEQPVVFIEVALTRGITRTIHEVIDTRPGDDGRRGSPDTAIFYSINNAQNGLAGLGLGKILVFQVVAELKRSTPAIKNFVTLSPIPGLWKRYLRPVLEGRDQPFELKRDRLGEFIAERSLQQLIKRCHQVHGTRPPDAAAVLLQVLTDPSWIQDESFARLLRKPLRELTYFYLTREKDKRGKTLNPVANFHLGNGASVSPGDVNFAANTSQRGLETSCGMMVNYIYSSSWLNQLGRGVQDLLPSGF